MGMNKVILYPTSQLDKPVMTQGNVEHWLGALLKEALHSVHVVIKNAHIAVEDPGLDLIDFLNNSPAQVMQFENLTSDVKKSRYSICADNLEQSKRKKKKAATTQIPS